MKKIYLLLVVCVVITSCKNTEEKPVENIEVIAEDNSKLATFRGEFLFLEDGAVFKGDTFIYGVTIDEMSKKLAAQVEPIKNEPFDMVGVFVRGVVSNKTDGEEGWDEILTIKEIINVSPKPAEADIKFEEKKS